MKIKSAEEIAQETQRYQTRLATEKLLLLYTRQSTKAQVLQNLESAMQQALDSLDYARKLGWIDEKIITINENAITGVLRSASGRLTIEEREGIKDGIGVHRQGHCRRCTGTGREPPFS